MSLICARNVSSVALASGAVSLIVAGGAGAPVPFDDLAPVVTVVLAAGAECAAAGVLVPVDLLDRVVATAPVGGRELGGCTLPETESRKNV